MILPDVWHFLVIPAVSADDSDGIFSLYEEVGNVIGVIPQRFVIIADGRGKKIVRYFFAVDIVVSIPQSANI